MLTVFTTTHPGLDYDATFEVESFVLFDPDALDPNRANVSWRKVEIRTGAYQIAYQCDRYRANTGCQTTLDDPRITSERRLPPSNIYL